MRRRLKDRDSMNVTLTNARGSTSILCLLTIYIRHGETHPPGAVYTGLEIKIEIKTRPL